MRFVLAPIRAGPSRELRSVLGDNITVIGTRAFSMWPGGPEHKSVKLGDATWIEDDGRREIMWTDLESGVQRSLAQGLPPSTTLEYGASGALWAVPGLNSDSEKQLFYAGAENGAPIQLGTVGAHVRLSWSLEFGGSLFWFESGNAPSLGRPVEDGALMEASLHGDGARKVVALKEHRLLDTYGENLGAWKGSLYCLAYERTPNSRPPSVQMCLARIRPELPEPFEIIRRFPPHSDRFHFDNGYVYFLQSGTSRGLIDTLLDDRAGERITSSLFRIPLP
jgi:hypothetical protein